MKWVVCHQGRLQVEEKKDAAARAERRWWTRGLTDAIATGAVHEFLFETRRGHAAPMFTALWVARGIVKAKGTTIWCDGEGLVYPPAVEMGGIPVKHLRVIRPRREDLVWAVAECLACRGVSAVVARVPARMSRAEVRRLQLAAERGESAGLFLRPTGPGSDVYAAATRWLVAPARGERDVQRWELEMVHGHGRQLGQRFLLERRCGCDEANVVHLPAVLPDRAAVSQAV
jgi:hypothetical protein